jgi:hypothetical protein
MKTVIDYLDNLKGKLGSDYKTAKLMEVDKTTISNIRRRGLMSDETAVKVADLLEISREEVLIAAAIARSEGEVKASWVKLYESVSRAALVILAAGIVNAGYDLSFNEIDSLNYGISLTTYSANNIHYAKLKLLAKRILRRFTDQALFGLDA